MILAQQAVKVPLDLLVNQDRLDLRVRTVLQGHKVLQVPWAQPAKRALQAWLDSLELMAMSVQLVLEGLQDLLGPLGLVGRLDRLDH